MSSKHVCVCACPRQCFDCVLNILGGVVAMSVDGEDVSVDIFRSGVVTRPGVALTVVGSATTKCGQYSR